MSEQPQTKTETLAETKDFIIWIADEPDGERTYHLQLNNLTVHFFEEEWREFKDLVSKLGG
jgi:hypothetical protein